ncbi:MAG: hypothetical protein WCI55_16780 [Armatimonadota bacterium]
MLYPKDPKVRVVRHDKTLKIEWNWGGGGHIFLFVGVALLPFFWWTFGLPTINHDVRPLGEHIGLFFMATCLVSLPIILGALTMMLNKTMIHADHERFLVRVGPLRWKKSKLVPANDIQQFFVSGNSSGQATVSSLYLLDANSHTILIASYFPSGFASHQICHELQDWYGLDDLPVYGHNDLPHQPGPRAK